MYHLLDEKEFKKLVKCEIISKCYYSIGEYLSDDSFSVRQLKVNFVLVLFWYVAYIYFLCLRRWINIIIVIQNTKHWKKFSKWQELFVMDIQYMNDKQNIKCVGLNQYDAHYSPLRYMRMKTTFSKSPIIIIFAYYLEQWTINGHSIVRVRLILLRSFYLLLIAIEPAVIYVLYYDL